ncbi:MULTISPECIES: class IIb bacteriocin, lactobin A/cerein 7B family [Cyanophyceae]|uniref:class IIb bacteriocin, lactobin A/cerein 7B family n=1 Tax=Cyanophyceae TaxID=3028117 RepID=UPI001688C530|nr:class IIb bacteriocin, lactobin A/cerein 7B family [Trichocoleus sp. FACHB-40]MBD2001715.1 class IIb bacteriocin, lactobin A/cerein 7B family [Trichocoleus sp. FACHB-40]
MSEQTSPQTRQDIEAHMIAQAWKDEAYKQELLSNPKAVIEREFGVQLPHEVNVHVMEEDSSNLYFVLPACPNLSGAELSDEQLETVAGGVLPLIATGAAIFVAGAVDGYLENQA